MENELDAILINQELPGICVIALGHIMNIITKDYSDSLKSKRVITISDLKYNLPYIKAPIHIRPIGKFATFGEAFTKGFNIKKWFQESKSNTKREEPELRNWQWGRNEDKY